MASPISSTRIWFRAVILTALIVVMFYVSRPLYWKISATIYDIRNNKQSARQGLSQFVHEALGWSQYHNESDSVLREGYSKKSGVSSTRKVQ